MDGKGLNNVFERFSRVFYLVPRRSHALQFKSQCHPPAPPVKTPDELLGACSQNSRSIFSPPASSAYGPVYRL